MLSCYRVINIAVTGMMSDDISIKQQQLEQLKAIRRQHTSINREAANVLLRVSNEDETTWKLKKGLPRFAILPIGPDKEDPNSWVAIQWPT